MEGSERLLSLVRTKLLRLRSHDPWLVPHSAWCFQGYLFTQLSSFPFLADTTSPRITHAKLFEGRKLESFFYPLPPLPSPTCHSDLLYTISSWIVTSIADRKASIHTHAHMCAHTYIHRTTYVYRPEAGITGLQVLNPCSRSQHAGKKIEWWE